MLNNPPQVRGAPGCPELSTLLKRSTAVIVVKPTLAVRFPFPLLTLSLRFSESFLLYFPQGSHTHTKAACLLLLRLRCETWVLYVG